MAETIAHVLAHQHALVDEPAQAVDESAQLEAARWRDAGLAFWVEQGLLPLKAAGAQEQIQTLQWMWGLLDPLGRFLLTKLVGGGFRVGVSKLLVQRALALHAGLEPSVVAQRMMGYTHARHRPTAQHFEKLLEAPGETSADSGQPYPFFLAHAVDEATLAQMGDMGQWLFEWKYDGIRAQIVKRAGQVWIWSRGEELITDRFPEVTHEAMGLPDGTVLDGELLVMVGDQPAPFSALQPRINRKTLSRKLLQEAPVSFIAYDLLERSAQDIRSLALWQRRQALHEVLDGGPLRVSPQVQELKWQDLVRRRLESRERGVEGLMIKHAQAPYGVGRRKPEGFALGAWWKWKIDPMTVDAVLVYAQRGHGRRASVYTDYTFAVWNRVPRDEAEVQSVLQAIESRQAPVDGALQLVPVAKAYSGLTDAEFAEVDKVIRSRTIEKFGPVRSVVPSLVFELGFEGIQASPRHRSGVALRFPRMLRIRHDKTLVQADCLQSLKSLMGSGQT